MSTAIILGSARDMGNTHQLVRHIANDASVRVFNLANYIICPYDYAHENRNDDFLPLMKEILTFDNIVLASPVYWYSPSSVMKVFLDRLSDLLTIEKDLGRQLRLKSGAVIATGSDQALTPCFEEMFRLTYNYLGIRYKGTLYCPCAEEIEIHRHRATIDEFVRALHVK